MREGVKNYSCGIAPTSTHYFSSKTMNNVQYEAFLLCALPPTI